MNQNIDYRAFDEAINLAKRGIAPCAHCGERVPPGAEHLAEVYAIKLAGLEKCAVFCSPFCLVAHVREGRHVHWERMSHGELYLPEKRGYFTFNGCFQCNREEESASYVVVVSPFDTPWGSDCRWPSFCSDACLLDAFCMDAEEWSWWPAHEKWFFAKTPDAVPLPQEAPWRHASGRGKLRRLPARHRRCIDKATAQLTEQRR